MTPEEWRELREDPSFDHARRAMMPMLQKFGIRKPPVGGKCPDCGGEARQSSREDGYAYCMDCLWDYMTTKAPTEG